MAQLVSHVGNIWIGPWANFLHCMDRTFIPMVFFPTPLLELAATHNCKYSLQILMGLHAAIVKKGKEVNISQHLRISNEFPSCPRSGNSRCN